MKLYIVFAQRKCAYEGQYAPETVAIADEYSHDCNPDYLEKELAKARDNDEFVAVELIEVDLGEDGFQAIQDRLTGLTTVQGGVTTAMADIW